MREISATHLSNVPLPIQSESDSGWESDRDGIHRLVWGPGLRPAGTSIAVAWHAVQKDDGTVVDPGVMVDQVLMDGTCQDCLSFTLEQARAVALAILHATFHLEGWVAP